MAVGGNTCCEWMKAQGDVARAIGILARIMDYGTWDKPEFKLRAAVT